MRTNRKHRRHWDRVRARKRQREETALTKMMQDVAKPRLRIHFAIQGTVMNNEFMTVRESMCHKVGAFTSCETDEFEAVWEELHIDLKAQMLDIDDKNKILDGMSLISSEQTTFDLISQFVLMRQSYDEGVQLKDGYTAMFYTVDGFDIVFDEVEGVMGAAMRTNEVESLLAEISHQLRTL